MNSTCAPIDVEVSGVGVAFGAALAAATFFVPAPQIYKIVKNKSSMGVAPVTLCFVVTYAIINVSAMVATKWKQLTQIAQHVGWGGIRMELDLLQGLFSITIWTEILVASVWYKPHDTRWYRSIVACTYAAVIAAVALIFKESAADPCGPVPLALAEVYGYISGVCTMVAFLPQLYTTWKCKSAGSLSLIFTFIQVGGCYMIAINQAIVTKDPWVIWLPTVISGSMQLLILCLATYYSCCGKGQVAPGAGSEGLLEGGGASDPRYGVQADEAERYNPHAPMDDATAPDATALRGLPLPPVVDSPGRRRSSSTHIN